MTKCSPPFASLLVASTLALSLSAPALVAGVHCVENSVGLHTALTTAAGNNEADDIQLVQGAYSGSFSYTSDQTQALNLLGGYTPGCTARIVAAANTVIGSGGAATVLTLLAPNMATESRIEGLTLRQGEVVIAEGGNYLVQDFDITDSGIDIDDPRQFVEQQYLDFLGRPGDSGGIDYWTGLLAGAAATPGQMVDFFFSSAEFQNNIAPVARLYFAYFDRFPDYDGLMFWVSAFLASQDLNGMSQAFADSDEFELLYGPSLDNSAFINLVYQNVLGRPADAEGLAYWVAQMAGPTGLSRGQMMVAFSESDEYRARSYKWVQVTMMYTSLLRRAPDEGGFDYWVGQIGGGRSVLDLIELFLDSDEYRERFQG